MTITKNSIALLTIGNELLDGRTINTNAAYFGESIQALGLEVIEARTVPDTLEAIGEALHELAVHTHIIVTGGLGPTSDDLTAVAAGIAFSDPCRYHAEAERDIRATLKRIGFPYTKTQKRQAFLPAHAKIIANRWGIAPGFQMRVFKATFYFLPGVPRECRPMFDAAIAPKLRRIRGAKKLLHRSLWRCFGEREADLYARIRPLVMKAQKLYGANFDFSSQIPFPSVDIRIEFWRGKGTRTASKKEIEEFSTELTKKLAPITYTRARESLAAVVIRLLRQQKASLATAESCTGGLVGEMLTDVAGASEAYRGGVVSYANSAKEKLLGVRPSTLRRHGAVSHETAQEMAKGVRHALGADYVISLTGVSGPGGGSAQKPVGTLFVGISDCSRTESVHRLILRSQGDRLQNRLFASFLALDMLRKLILENQEKTKGK